MLNETFGVIFQYCEWVESYQYTCSNVHLMLKMASFFFQIQGGPKLNVSNCTSGLVGFLGGHNFARRSSNCHSHGVFISFHRVMASNCRLPFFIAKQDTNQLGKRRSTVGFSNAVKLDFIFVSPHWCCRNLSHLASCDN